MACKDTKNKSRCQVFGHLKVFICKKAHGLPEKTYLCVPIMSKGTFTFKKFAVHHARSSMPVGTDAVLLGSWTAMEHCAHIAGIRILDIGSGCGLLALMAAQRCPSAYVLGIDVDAPSVEEARENSASSPFAARTAFLLADVRDFSLAAEHRDAFSLILCNPPYYTEDVLPPDLRRSIARNAGHLGFAELLEAVCLLLADEGVFSVVIPMQARETFVSEAMSRRLYLRRECRVQTVPGKSPKRVLMEFCKGQCGEIRPESLVLQDADGHRTAEYTRLCGDFYL